MYTTHVSSRPPIRQLCRAIARCVALFVFAVSFTHVARAQRVDFPATYKIANVAAEGNSVHLTLSLTVHNYSGADIRDCGIVLYGSAPHADLIGSFNLVKLLPSYEGITVSRQFTLTQAEYDRLESGVSPVLQILLPDGSGGTRFASIDARREVPRPPTSR